MFYLLYFLFIICICRSVSDNLQGALASFARNLSVVHQEISAPNMQGDSNFRVSVKLKP